MISLFAGAEREAKRQQLSDPLELLSRHIDFVAIAAVIDGHLRLGTGAKG
ncbi:transposase, partial [Xanthomonas arboricola]